jgi:ribonuclease P protein component
LRRKKFFSSLTKRRDFELVFKEGVPLSSKYLVMYARPNELSFNRLGLSISKKAGNAVTRNKIKRLMREAMRKLLKGLPLNYDFVIVARKSSVEGKLDDFMLDINNFIMKITGVNAILLQEELAKKKPFKKEAPY